MVVVVFEAWYQLGGQGFLALVVRKQAEANACVCAKLLDSYRLIEEHI
jgi:hypothetical protein